MCYTILLFIHSSHSVKKLNFLLTVYIYLIRYTLPTNSLHVQANACSKMFVSEGKI